MPAAETPTALDDLWHAAVNSHGRYFHASNPQSLANAIANSLAGIKATKGSAAAAATSTPNLTAQSNLAFTTKYATGDWSGQLSARTINLQTGEVSANPLWQADVLLDATNPTTRRILTFDNNQPGKLKAFNYGSFTPTEKAWVDNLCAAPAKLSQCVKLPATDQATVNNGQTIVDFLRGVNTNSGTLLRARTHLLGDVVDSMPVYVRAPTFNFADAVPRTYADFKNRNSARQGVVYIGANDGMLHAFNADTGLEMWAYVPRMLIKKLYLLADAGYARSHTYFVDGTPSVMDVFYGGDWHTVLVGGLNAGGAGFYALDITDPNNPLALWELCADVCDITDPDLGLSFGNPIITKRNGQWVVLLTSGYNNASGTENLYIVDVVSGAFQKIPTGVGTPATPGGLAKIAAFADNFQLDNTTKYVYGGDLLGNVWRFDLTTAQATVLPLALLTDASGKAQPVTTRPELGMVRGFRVLYVGTGKFLGASDAPDISPQTLYAFKDTGAPLGNLRTGGLVPKILTASNATTRTVTPSTVDWLTQSGWFVDFNLGPGERVNVDPQLTLGTLTLHTNIPNADPCSVGGDSWLYQFSYDTGSYVPTAPGLIVGQKITGSTVVGFVIVSLPGGGLKEIATDALGRNPVFNVPVGTSAGGGRRIGWRELTR
jgi:type IV pilus assembly protein PilY1